MKHINDTSNAAAAYRSKALVPEDHEDTTDYATDLGQLEPEQERREDMAALVTIGLFVLAVLALFVVFWAVRG